ncbi:error-prone DNA polymerase [[Flexibacter] sp. ATCC 35208]|uniref:error-prone DNA polymerase n=1 Tax=[Flexibacter] sp. ATCC 35208 TaxID=1936242 RepID=UPI0009C6F4F3|nr:error-prone DNA polymerase [[Flexibacter] sp. ATCC 35208]OMP80118.1 error-prone DNA polymerase [[Flexibacter] sp. ATCC 35208]
MEQLYTELQVTSNFSFLRGASHPEELVEQAALYGYAAIGIADHNTLAGVVRAHVAAKAKNMRIIVGARLDLQDGPGLLAFPTDKAAYGRLSALLSYGNLRTEKGRCELYKDDVYKHREGIHFIAIPPDEFNDSFDFDDQFKKDLGEYSIRLAGMLSLAMVRRYQGDDQKRFFRLAQLSDQLRIPLVATNDVHYHEQSRRELQDVLTCVREKCTITEAGFRLHPNAERYMKAPAEMMRLFRQYPHAIRRTQEIADACQFSLDSLEYVYPEEIVPKGISAQQYLTELAWQGATEYFGSPLPPAIVDGINYELKLIGQLNYANYFLTVYDFVKFARSKGILCQGRGSAANSTICYCLGITAVNPTKFDLLVERFISPERNEPPDIDIDFEHSRREEVIQYIYERYGRDRAAIVATVTQQHYKGALRDVGKAMGLSVDILRRLGKDTDVLDESSLAAQGINGQDPHVKKAVELTMQMIGFPRQLGQHTGGFVITQGRLTDLCPILNARMEDRTNIEWNKDDIEALGFLKIDVLALGMLTCIRKGFELAKSHYGLDLTLANIPQDDPRIYEMISNADTIGVFQIESRAQMSMLPRLKPKTFYDLVIEVAIVRPGPIQGDMVHPYLRRRNGEEPVDYPSKELEQILGRTLGVPLFQEQAMKIAIVAAGFTPAEADHLRRSMATFKAKGLVTHFQKKLVDGMVGRGYSPEFSQRVFKQLEGFGSYGFPESHAASFALLVYVSAWLKCLYPDIFAAALLNSMPMGFYQPAQIIIDARNHGVDVRPADINLSEWDNTLEEQSGKYRALRLGFRQITGIREADIKLLVDKRSSQYSSINMLLNAGISISTLERLADADAFRSIGLDRRKALWEVIALKDNPIALFAGQPSESTREGQIELPFMSESEHVVQDYAAMALSLKAHPVSFLREKLSLLHILSTNQINNGQNGIAVKVAGLVLVRQRPGTASGVTFITIEDETGYTNLVVFKNVYAQFKKEIGQAKLLMVEGMLQREGKVVHVIVSSCTDMSKMLRTLVGNGKDDPAVLTLSRADEKDLPAEGIQSKPNSNKQAAEHHIPEARNFK